MDITEIKKGLDGIKIVEDFFEKIFKETETNGCFANIKTADSKENITENKTVKKPYSGRVYCLRSNNSNIINRYVYSIKDGYIEDSAGWLTPIYNRERKIITSFEEFVDSLGGKWIEVKDIEEKDDTKKDYTDVIICTDNKNEENFTIGKIYNVKNGTLKDDTGRIRTKCGFPFLSLEEINNFITSASFEKVWFN